MIARNFALLVFVVTAIATYSSGANAEKTVYKWVDEDGQVHFGDAPPAEAKPTDTETLTIPKSPDYVKPAAATTSKAVEKPAVQAVEEAPLLFKKTDVADLSLAELDLRCDEAREKMIAPLREAEIAKCKQDKREDPAFCERFNADFGDGGRTVSGAIRPRMFDDLPQCVEANQERNRR